MLTRLFSGKYKSWTEKCGRVFQYILIGLVMYIGAYGEVRKTKSYYLPLESISLSPDDVFRLREEHKYVWSQIMGPQNLSLLNRTHRTCAIRNLRIGYYVFMLQIDLVNSTKRTSKFFQIEIFEAINKKPKSNAGGERTVFLPVKMIKIIGSASSDDKNIIRYRWSADRTNPAGVEIIGDSDKQRNLMLKKLFPGKYIYKLTVEDAAGLRDVDQMTLIVKGVPHLGNIIQIQFMADLRNFTYRYLKNFKSQVYLILSKSIRNIKLKIEIMRLQKDPINGCALLEFYVTNGSVGHTFPGSKLVKILRPVILDDINIFMHPVVLITTPDCQQSCFIHGYCDQPSGRCVCDMFWINNLWNNWVDEHSMKDCEWNIIYTSTVGLVIVLLTVVFCRQLYLLLWRIPSCGLTPDEVM